MVKLATPLVIFASILLVTITSASPPDESGSTKKPSDKKKRAVKRADPPLPKRIKLKPLDAPGLEGQDLETYRAKEIELWRDHVTHRLKPFANVRTNILSPVEDVSLTVLSHEFEGPQPKGQPIRKPLRKRKPEQIFVPYTGEPAWKKRGNQKKGDSGSTE